MAIRPSSLAAYKDLFDRLLDATLLIDPATGNILEANAIAERIFGVENDHLVGTPVSDFVPKSLRAGFDKEIRIAARRYHPRQFEARIQSPLMLIEAEILICPLKLSDGRAVLQMMARDVTEKREAARKLADTMRELQTANTKLEQLSTIDGLTGLFNHRHFKTRLAEEHERAERYLSLYSLVFCDIDFFKNYNDNNGHPEGDALLKRIGHLIQSACRGTDMPARYGGEEFVVLASGVGVEGARVLGERIRANVENTSFLFGDDQPGGRLTISVGVASFPEHGRTYEEVLKSADLALYHSKMNGKNRVTTAAELTGKVGGNKKPKLAA